MMPKWLDLLRALMIAAMLTLAVHAAPVHGVWVPTPEHTDFWRSKTNMAKWLDELEAMGFNTVYVAMWNQGRTLYPSAVMKAFTGIEIDEKLVGRDPLRELLDVAKGRKIKVVAWFEFGFATDYKGGLGREILSRKPEWAALDVEGKPVEKNGFHWMNSLDPAVQDFVLSLMLEVVDRYEVDGVQGDDRLPALPSSAGYNPGVVSHYQATHDGELPPRNAKDPAWIQWRADLLSDFMAKIHREIKQRHPTMRISMAPSAFPWGRDEYLQDWPTWLSEGWVDELLPQLYRYDLGTYKSTLIQMQAAIPVGLQHKVFPGVLLGVGKDYVASELLLRQMVQANRQAGFEGEVFFYNEGLRKRRAFFAKAYR